MDKQRQKVAGPMTYVVTALLLFAFISFLIIMYTINSGIEFSWEKPVQTYFQNWNKGFTHTFFKYETELGSRLIIGIITLMLMIWLWWKKRDYIGMGIVAIAVASTDQLNKFVKHLVARDRPSINPSIDAVGYSFPSGHAMLTIVTFLLVAYFVSHHFELKGPKVLVWMGAFVLILLTGISRIVLSAHYPSDIVGGYCLGLFCLIIALKLYRVLKSLIKNKQVPLP
ncbi:phosphatase PAP2 family protein [Bacillus massiliigorillae]|uniref:phosphatase PAP2 family protein n=1 Tax=Bacillus massiliigorillae TaxID=1243664 RepID=UPI00039EAD24|nr:phosphatase PAP2 family protein [Bacillus massiliigorillae]